MALIRRISAINAINLSRFFLKFIPHDPDPGSLDSKKCGSCGSRIRITASNALYPLDVKINFIPMSPFHVPDKLKLFHCDVEVFPFKLWRQLVLLKLSQPIFLKNIRYRLRYLISTKVLNYNLHKLSQKFSCYYRYTY